MQIACWSGLSCTSLVPRPLIVVFDLGTRLHVHMHTKLQNDILLDGQQPECCEWFLFTRGNPKMLSDRSALPSPVMSISSLLKRHMLTQ